MKSYSKAKVLLNEQIANSIFNLTLKCDDIKSVAPGQFIMLYADRQKNILPRPISICEFIKQGEIRLVYQVVGEGTTYFSQLKQQDEVSLIAPLGNGFNVSENFKNAAIIGGGIGIPPLLQLCKTIIETKPEAKIMAFLGYRSQPFLYEDFEKLGVNVKISTDDGSVGFKGNAVSNLKKSGLKPDIIYCCGPKPMLKAAAQYANEQNVICQISTEERMACGIGACVGCVVKSKDGNYKKVCKDGPVFYSNEVEIC